MLLPHQSTDAASASATSSGLMDELRRNKAAFATVTSSPLGEERLRGGGDDETEITTTTTLPLPPLNANKTLAFPQQKRSRESTEAVMATDKDLDDALLKENTARKTKRTRRKSSRLHPTTPVLYPNNCDSSPSKLKWKYWKLTTTTTHVADNRPALAVRIPRTPVLFKRTAINTFTDNDTNSIKHCVQDEADSDLMLPIPGPESPDIRGESYFLSAAAESSSSSQLQQLRQQQRCHGLGEVLMGDMEEEKKEAVMVQEKFAVDDEHLEIFTTPSSIPSSPPPPPLYNNITMDVHDLHPPPTSSAPLVLQQHQEYQQLPSFTPSSFPLIDCCNTAATVDNDASQQLVDDDDESEDEGIVNNDTNIDSSSSANLIVFSTAREDTRSQQTYTPNRSNDNIINPDDQCNYEHIDGDSQLPDSPLQFTQNEQMNSDDEGENQRLQHQLQLQSQPVLFTTTSTNYTNGDEMEEGCGIEVEADMFMEFGGGGGDRVLVRISEGGDAEESNEYLEGRDSVAANPTHPVNAPAVSTITAPLATTTTTTTVAATAISSIESEITHDDLLLLSNLSAQDGFALDSSNGGGGGGFSSGGSHDSAIVVAKKGKEDHEEAVGMAPGAASVSNGVASGGSGGGKGEDSEEWGFFDSQVERQIHAATQGYNQVKMPPPCFLNDRIPPPPNFMDVDNSNTEKHVRDDNNIDLSSALAPPPPSTSSSLFTTAASINSNNVIKVTAPFPSFDNPASSRTVAAAEGNDLFVLASRIPFVSDQGRLAADGTGVENIVKPLVPPPPRIQLPSMKIAGCSSARNPDPISLLKKVNYF